MNGVKSAVPSFGHCWSTISMSGRAFLMYSTKAATASRP
jgi:hypothetical protein